MDERFKKINRLLSHYSLGQFDYSIEMSSRLDEVDAFISGVNMLGEELKAITISRNYFNNIFNSVSDMVFILDKEGKIERVNRAVVKRLNVSEDQLQNNSLDNLQEGGRKSISKAIIRQLKNKATDAYVDTVFLTSGGESIPVRVRSTYLMNETGKKTGILLIVQDISHQLETESLVIRAIIDTQENEQKRLAKDLHDSLGQQLSAIKFYLSALQESSEKIKTKRILTKSNKALTDVIDDMRAICFNLMPKTLEEFGLQEAVQEMKEKVMKQHQIQVDLFTIKRFPPLSASLQTDIYRIIQEFINNTLKYASATKIVIRFGYAQKILKVQLGDNGKGFNLNSASLRGGMGLHNVKSRVRSQSGTISIKSEAGKGCKYVLSFPLKQD